MKGVSNIAGYINQNKVFAIMINGFTSSAKEMDELIEEILFVLEMPLNNN